MRKEVRYFNMVRFIIVRHGYSEANKAKRFAGQSDVPLDAVGLAQARSTANYIRNTYKVDRIYTSDLSRACETVRPLAEALGMEVIRRRDLREVDVGIWQDMRIEDVKNKYTEDYESYKANPGLYRFEGGESYTEACARAVKAFTEIAKENDGKTVVIGTHGGIVRAIRMAWNGIPPERMVEIPHVPNASVTVADWENGAVIWQTVGYDDHLEDKTTEEGIK